MTSILKHVSRNARGWVWPVAALSAASAALYSPMRPLGLLPPDEAAFDLPGFILRAVLGFTIAWMAGWFSLPRMGARQFRYAFWTAAAFALTRREGRGLLATALAVAITLAVYLIPHSVWGTQYDYTRGRVTAGPSGQ